MFSHVLVFAALFPCWLQTRMILWRCWRSFWILGKMMFLGSQNCLRVWGGFWGLMLTFVVAARRDDVLGFTRLLHVARTRFGGVLRFDADVRCGCCRQDDVLGITKLLHVALTRFGGGSGVRCWRSLWMLGKVMFLGSRGCFMRH